MDTPDSCNIHLSEHGNWYDEGSISFTGNIINQGEVLSEKKSCDKLQNIKNKSDLKDFLSESTGFFGFVMYKNNNLYFGTDQVGSKKMYYSISENTIHVSDNYNWIVNEVLSNDSAPEIIKKELLHTGYITGNDTLAPEIKKTQPAELFSVDLNQNNPECNRFQYYELSSISNTTIDKYDLFDELEEILDDVFKNMRLIIGDSPLILALSGGYDSRLLAHMLYKYDFEETYAFTHNIQNNRCNQAQKVANAVGIELVELDCTHNDLNEIYNSKHWKLLEDHVGGSAPAMELKMSVVLNKIKKHSQLPNRGFIVQGHTIAEAGKRIPSVLLDKNRIDRSEIVDDILSRHYTGTLRSPEQEILNDELRNRVLQWLNMSETVPQQIGIQKCENWYWRERVHNHILCNPIIYDYFGYNYWNPFLDKNYFTFYEQIPVKYRYKRRIFEKYTEKLDSEKNIVLNNIPVTKRLILNSPIEPLARKLKTSIDSMRERDPSNVYKREKRYGFLTEEEFLNRYTGSERHSYFLAENIIQKTDL